MIKEVKYAGLSSVPGDYECGDGELAVAIDVVNENGEIGPFLHPEPFMSVTGKLMFVHKGRATRTLSRSTETGCIPGHVPRGERRSPPMSAR